MNPAPLDPRHRSRCVHDARVERRSGRRRWVHAGWRRNLHRHEAARIEADVDGCGATEALQQQARSDEQHQRERELHRDQHPSQP